MPELPEVETIRRQLAAALVGTTVVAAAGHPSPRFNEAADVVGARFVTVGRRGKYLLIATDDARELIIHLGMTGTIGLTPMPPTPVDGTSRWRRATWTLDDGRTLDYDDQRRFGRIAVVPAGHHERLPTLAALGPEPFDPAFTPAVFHRRLAGQRRHVKTALLSQRVVAGVGNIYADEALWRARINPVVRRLGIERSTRLHGAMLATLSDAIDHGGTRFRDYRSVDGDTGRHQFHLDAYGRAGLPCHRCGATLARRVVDGRGTTWCPTCQAR
ncbi:MAG TPA: bifunctional DNA-formamidopyrimidine glycosylase/DNA-(apurinic or apyrimidinic site) lyase [Acidimicrobiales bacterium]|nr:bifunctional DNA-formamidopyrimidine glycosylase/DNA-(apurinic or apyrimidinic site) lyase [Acidimicrobiales bacterium]